MSIASAGVIPVGKVMDEQADVENKYSFPTTCQFYIPFGVTDKSGNVRTILFIWGTGAPGSDYNNATLDSVYFDRTNHAIYIKDDTGANWAQVTTTT